MANMFQTIKKWSWVAWIINGVNALFGLYSKWDLVVTFATTIGFTFWAWWEWATAYGYFPVALAGLFTFMVTIWIIVGIKSFKNVKKPTRGQVQFDYNYGLSLAGLRQGLDEEDEKATLQLGLYLYNATEGPIKYEVESFDIILGDRTISEPNFTNKGGFISRGCQALFDYPAFSKEVRDSLGRKSQGKIKFSIKYGHPEYPFSRILKMELRVTLILDGKTGPLYRTLSESDEPIEEK